MTIKIILLLVFLVVVVVFMWYSLFYKSPIRGLFLDDERIPSDVYWHTYPENVSWTIVRSYDDFIIAIGDNHYDIMSFDHDLGDVEYTGYDLLKELIESHMEGIVDLPKEIYFHTQNPIGRNNMAAYWRSYRKSL